MSEAIKDSHMIGVMMARFGVTEAQAEIMAKRQEVYGEPKANHKNIAQIWAGLLQPWAHRIARGDPLPPHVVALLLVGLKYSRMRYVFHDDNFMDAHNYEMFAKAFHREWEAEQGESPIVLPPCPGDDHELVIEWRPKS